MPSKIRIAIGLACALVAGTRDASGCSCNLNPPCAAFWRADAVFIGYVTANETRQVEHQPEEFVTTLTVLRTFRGEQLPSRVLRGVMTSCASGLTVGETYLVYASRGADGRFNAGACSGTKPLADADEDIAIIQTLPSLSPLGWIYGTVHRAVRDPDTRAIRGGVAVGVPVTLTSGGRRASVLTDQEGRFEFTGLAPGTYSVQPDVPATMRAVGGAAVVVTARSCSPVSLQMVSTARVSGRLYLPDGSPPPQSVPIELRDADVVTPAGAARGTRFSDREGRFTFDQVEPGRYYLGMNTEFPPNAERPYVPRFYPNAGSPQEAYVIEVGDGEQKTDFDFALLPLSDLEIAAAVAATRPADPSPVDARPLFAPQLFPRRARPLVFALPKGGLHPQ